MKRVTVAGEQILGQLVQLIARIDLPHPMLKTNTAPHREKNNAAKASASKAYAQEISTPRVNVTTAVATYAIRSKH